VTDPETPDIGPIGTIGQRSPDGTWWWDGSKWQAVATSPPTRAAQLKRSLLWFVAGVIDTTVFPLLIPWVFFVFGLIQGVRRSKEGGGARAVLGIAANAIGLAIYVVVSLAATKGSRAFVVSYLLTSPSELRLFNYLH